MGFNNFISSILSRWKVKRKRDDGDGNDIGAKKIKIAQDYALTPLQKGPPIEKRTHYTVGEELPATESRQVEYKEGGFLFKREVLSQHIKRYACAFLNSEGGVLLAGITDKGIVRGVTISNQIQNTLMESLRYELDKFRPFVHSSLYSLKTYPVITSKKKTFLSSHSKLVVVEISFSKGVEGELYETGDHHVYLRRDGGVQGPLKPLDIKNFVITRYNNTLKDRKTIKVKEDEKENRLKKKGMTYITID